MVKKNENPTRRHNTLVKNEKHALNMWMLRQVADDKLLYGTREKLAIAAAEALGFSVVASNITTAANATECKFFRTERQVKSAKGRKGKAAPPGNTNQQLARVVKEIVEQLVARVPGFQLSAKGDDILDKIVKAWKVPVADAGQPRVQPTTDAPTQPRYDQQGYGNAAGFAAAQAVEISRQQNAGHPAPQFNPQWPAQPQQSPANVNQQELPFSG